MTPADEGGASATIARPAIAGPAAATAAPAAQHVAAPAAARGPRPGGGLLASVIGHLAFGALVLGGVLFWQNYPKVLTPMADTVCADRLLGQYRSPGGSELAAAAGASEKADAATPAAGVGSGANAVSASASASGSPTRSEEPARVVAPSDMPTPATASSTASPATPSGTTAAAVGERPAPVAAAKPATGTVPAPAVTTETDRAGVAGEREPSALPQPTQTRPVATVPQPGPAASMTTTAAPSAMAAAASAPAASGTAASPAAASAPLAATAASGAASEQPAKPTPAAASASLSERWQSARIAYRAGKPEAIESYAQLIKDFPDVADLPGELGNIYYGAGRMQDAAEQYFEAAQRHLRGPTPGMATCLVGVLKRLNAPLADKLSEQAKAPCPLATQDAGKGARSG